MQLAYTDSFTVTTTGITIRKAGSNETPGGALIPPDINVVDIVIYPEQDENGDFKKYLIIGMWDGSGWVPMYKEIPLQKFGPISDEKRDYCKVKSDSGSITMYIQVKGVA